MMDIVVIGGGLAGLINAIQLSKAGLSVCVIEKNEYPFHRVCGEYISNETLPFLESIGLNPFDLGAVALTEFRVSSPKGHSLQMPLDLGGFGISRFTLDEALYKLGKKEGVHFLLQTKVLDVKNETDGFLIKTDKAGDLRAKLCIGTYGKRANLDSSLQRDFFKKRSPYVGIKYHIKTNAHPDNQIALHNFAHGYCGISRVEDDTFCLCYLTTRDNLKKSGNIPTMEKNIVQKNPFLRQLFSESTFIFEQPLVINEVSFAPKPLIEQGILMCGDTAGMIAPLCGNGMAMAIHSAKILSELVIQYFKGELTRSELEASYTKKWKDLFATRLWAGRNIQKFFGHPLLSEMLLSSGKIFPPIARLMMSKTHGKSF
jgi:flavin-dependent dehydrogenase